MEDTGFTLANGRRRSNSSSYKAGLIDFKTKFEHVEQDPVFEEDVHGALLEEDDILMPKAIRLDTQSSSESSVEGDDAPKSA